MRKTVVFETAFNSYRQVEHIGDGGSGIVLRVEDEDGHPAALKYIRPQNLSTDKRKRFKNELEFCSKTDHPHIAKVIDRGFIALDGQNCPFCIMPYYEKTLRKLMQNGIPTDKILPYFSQILDGVEAAHLQGVWHRDLKPENILFDPATDTLVIADFGIAHFAEPLLQTAVETRAQDRLANFQYAAPEQREKGTAVDRRADIYALGLILNEMFTGKLAHGVGFKRIGEVAGQFAYLDELVDAMLRQSPEVRPSSVRDVKQQLIARGNDFISQQRLSELRQTAIPDTEVDDPLVLYPPEMVGAKWESGWLILTLSHDVNADWIHCFHNPGGRSAIMGKGPETFQFSGNTTKVTSRGDDAQRLIEHAKEYVRLANHKYRMLVEANLAKRRAAEERQLKERIALEEQTRTINANLRI